MSDDTWRDELKLKRMDLHIAIEREEALIEDYFAGIRDFSNRISHRYRQIGRIDAVLGEHHE